MSHQQGAVLPWGDRRTTAAPSHMLNNDWGVVRYPNFNEVSPIRFDGVDAATGKMICNMTPMKASTFKVAGSP